MIVNNGRDEIRDKLKELIDTIKVGTSGSAPSETDTDLGTPIFSGVSSDADGSIGVSRHKLRLNTAEGNGSLKEVGTFAGGIMVSRSIHATVDKDSSFELLVEVQMEVE